MPADVEEGLLYPYALDKGSVIVKAVNAARGEVYSCIGCGERMVLRRGHVLRAHFGHYSENRQCAPETVLHKMAKDAIREGIEAALSLDVGYAFSWFCDVCSQRHEGNLGLSAREVKTEVELDGVRPDVLLSSLKGKPLVAIEVVVSHWPEDEAEKAYSRLDLPVLMVKPGWEDLENLKAGLGEVVTFNAPCRAVRCAKCHKPMDQVIVGAFQGYKCYRCGKGMLVVGLVTGDKGYFSTWEPGMIKPARSVGVGLKRLRVRDYGRGCVVHPCPSCGANQGGEWDEMDYLWDLAGCNTPAVKTRAYDWCKVCDVWIENKRAVRSMTAHTPFNPRKREKG